MRKEEDAMLGILGKCVTPSGKLELNIGVLETQTHVVTFQLNDAQTAALMGIYELHQKLSKAEFFTGDESPSRELAEFTMDALNGVKVLAKPTVHIQSGNVIITFPCNDGSLTFAVFLEDFAAINDLLLARMLRECSPDDMG